MSAPTVRPIKSGTLFVSASFLGFVRLKTTNARTPVPKASTQKAVAVVIG